MFFHYSRHWSGQRIGRLPILPHLHAPSRPVIVEWQQRLLNCHHALLYHNAAHTTDDLNSYNVLWYSLPLYIIQEEPVIAEFMMQNDIDTRVGQLQLQPITTVLHKWLFSVRIHCRLCIHTTKYYSLRLHCPLSCTSDISAPPYRVSFYSPATYWTVSLLACT
jgi:hypothetical protein